MGKGTVDPTRGPAPFGARASASSGRGAIRPDLPPCSRSSRAGPRACIRASPAVHPAAPSVHAHRHRRPHPNSVNTLGLDDWVAHRVAWPLCRRPQSRALGARTGAGSRAGSAAAAAGGGGQSFGGGARAGARRDREATAGGVPGTASCSSRTRS